MMYFIVTSVLLLLVSPPILLCLRYFDRIRAVSRLNLISTYLLSSLPLLGHLPILSRCPHRILTSLSRHLGPVFTVWMGCRKVVVFNGIEAIRAALSVRGRFFDDRPSLELYNHYVGGTSLSFGHQGPGVRLQRHFGRQIVHRMVGSNRAGDIVAQEAAALVEKWAAMSGGFDPAEDVTLAVCSALYLMCYGDDSRLDEGSELRRLLVSKSCDSEVFAINKQSDLVPSCLRRFIVNERQRSTVIENMMKHKHLHDLAVQRRLLEAVDGRGFGDGGFESVLDEAVKYLSSSTAMEQINAVGLTAKQVTDLPLEFISAGSETSSATILWLLNFMIVYPDVQSRVHDELDSQLTTSANVTYADRRRLPYTHAVVLEAMRMAPVVPLALPHYADRDVPISSLKLSPGVNDANCVTVPAGSIIIANLWSVGRDPKVWGDDADIFRPERFLRTRCDVTRKQIPANAAAFPVLGNENGSVLSGVSSRQPSSPSSETGTGSINKKLNANDVIESNGDLSLDNALVESFYPFGYGGRRCVGEELGRLQVFVIFTTIMRMCNLLPVYDYSTSTSEINESLGDVIRPTSFKIRVVPR